jgi:sugar phosphate isomerase/epimerase
MRFTKYIMFFLLMAAGRTSLAQNIGIQLYSLRSQLSKDVPGTVALIKSWGITELEGGDTYGLPQVEFDKLLAQNGLKVSSVGADFNDLDKDVDKVIRNAKAFHAKMVMCAWIPHDGDIFTIADADRAVRVFNEAGKKLEKEGLTFCYHPHGYEFVKYGNGTLFDHMAEGMNPEYANFEMDVYWVKQSGTDPHAFFKRYSGRIKMLHLKDRRPGSPDTNTGKADEETNVVLGSGDVGIADLMKAARKEGVKYYFIEDESSRVVQQVPLSLAFLKSIR